MGTKFYESQQVLSSSLENLLEQKRRNISRWQQPITFNFERQADQLVLEEMLVKGEIERVVDPTSALADELFELHNPSDIYSTQLREAYKASKTEQGFEFGVWFYFPWSKELVRYPQKDKHRQLRTYRNRDLVTTLEQNRLLDSVVEVQGLSVGSRVVESLLLGGIGGTYIIGDPDTISPSNLNRMFGSIRDVGKSKLDFIAMEISEIDPFIIQHHLTAGFKDHVKRINDPVAPDIIIDEVDDLKAKVEMRLFARQKAIPLIMVTDVGDSSLVDVERYDLGFSKPFLGRLTEQDLTAIANGQVTEKQRIKHLLKLIGAANLTTRLIKSVAQINETIVGIPQLGTTASIGGALASIAAREILLGRSLESGRYVFSAKKSLKLDPNVSLLDIISTTKTVVLKRHSEN